MTQPNILYIHSHDPGRYVPYGRALRRNDEQSDQRGRPKAAVAYGCQNLKTNPGGR